MKVLVSAYFIKHGRVGGAEYMLYNLVFGLLKSGVEVVFLTDNKCRISEKFIEDSRVYPNFKLTECGFGFSRFLNEFMVGLFYKEKADAIIFPNYFRPPFVASRFGTVLTVIHDFQYRSFPEYFSFHKRIWLRLCHKITMTFSGQIVVISRFVKDHALELYGAKKDSKVAVVHNPISWGRFSHQVCSVIPMKRRKYLLSVCAHYPHKNLNTLLLGYAKLLEQRQDLDLILVGQRPEFLSKHLAKGSDLSKIIEDLGLENFVKFTGHVSDEQLAVWYKNAEVFLFPSIFEGFGMPPVEALGLGIKTIVSDLSPLTEVTHDRAIYVKDYMDPNAWCFTINQALESDDNGLSIDDVDFIQNFYSPACIANKYISLMSKSQV